MTLMGSHQDQIFISLELRYIYRELSLSTENPENMEEIWAEIEIPQQKVYDGGIRFPSVLSPIPSNFQSSPLSLFTKSIQAHKNSIETLLSESGAILFRGFPVNSASDFNDVIESFGYDELPYVGGAAPRTRVVGRVFTSNESPPEQNIPFHHEMVQLPKFPSKLFFFCEVGPTSGGETPIVLSHVVYDRMREKHPEFVDKLEENGLIYTRVLGDIDNPLSPIGKGWKSTFLTDDKSVAEQRAAEVGTKLEWIDNGVKTIMGPISAVKYNETRKRKTWFNSMTAAYTRWGYSNNDLPKTVTFGDGSLLPGKIIDDCLKILEDESVAFPWQRGDVLLVDNLAVLHARRACACPRRVLASLVK